MSRGIRKNNRLSLKRLKKRIDPYAFLYEPKTNLQRLLDEAYLELGDTSKIEVFNPFIQKRSKVFADNPMMEYMHWMKNPDYFAFTCKHLFGVTLLPFQQVILKALWNHKFPMLVCSRGAGKSWILAVYSILRAIFHQGCKVAIVGAAFRQSKIVFEYMETIWKESPLLMGLNGCEPRHQTDRWIFNIGRSEVIAIPLGTGDRIRGLRANYVIADEFSCLGCNSLIETNLGLIRISDCEMMMDIKLINREGNYELPQHFVKTPTTDVYEIQTRNGYSFKCSSIHKVMTMNGFKLAKDLTEDDYLVFDNKYKFPENMVYIGNKAVNKDLAYLIGILVSEGSINNKSVIRITNTNYDLLCQMKEIIEKYDKTLHPKIYKRKAYVDSRGWNCKECFTLTMNSIKFRKFLETIGLNRTICYNKIVPWSILRSPKNVVIAFLRGLFLGDGSAYIYKQKNSIMFRISYYSVCKQLCDEVHVLLKKLGVVSSMGTRKSSISKKTQYSINVNGKYGQKLCEILDIQKWNSLMKQSNAKYKEDFKYIVHDKKKNKWCILQLLCGKKHRVANFKDYDKAKEFYDNFEVVEHVRVKSVNKLDKQEILYDFYLPETHSFYADGFLHHNSINQAVFETVIRGFGSVSLDPIKKVKQFAKIEKLKEMGYDDEVREMESSMGFGNQIIISGTSSYTFNHFYHYWKKYKTIIESRGDSNKLQDVMKGDIPPDFNWKDYCIVRAPYDALPKGFMDSVQIAQAKATINKSIFQMEYLAVFPSDSEGFFKRTLIESCVCNPYVLINNTPISYPAVITGDIRKKYVIGIDPASESDNFAIVVLELCEGYRKIVYCWTINRQRLRQKLSGGKKSDMGFYSFCAKKIRDLAIKFPTDHIVIDSQGGGVAVVEALHDPEVIGEKALRFWPYIRQGENDIFWWEKPEKATDGEQGLHNLHVVNFADPQFVREANHGMRFDFENKLLLFPTYDALSLSNDIYAQTDSPEKEYDTLDDCYYEIEEIKNELSSITHTQTATGRDRWDTPEIKLPDNKKGHLRKDRYTALLIANEVARVMSKVEIGVSQYTAVGGYVGDPRLKKATGQMYVGPAHITERMNMVCGRGISRRR